ncbi:hypothetical protein HYH02_006694 [Chlamydomonas schloesseri]|uniref:BHLH domain-containing protein n=1 Tax=Chlamydomonas schloesseri TaxID=2026947 RepID=A0A835T6X0_9CHLO|nr:hypothetical protein HYH02_006694 [Chlamydomonas schloesseri]|eukprot:KAG2432711.1 hypothetical protein HYH02_006694 [Chlamydomonas schloesseri]
MSEALDFGLGDSQYVFTDLELNELLGVIERKAAGEVEPDALDFLRATDGNGLALQFQPRSHKDNANGCSLEQSAVAAVKLEELPAGCGTALSSALASPVDTPALNGAADPTSLYGSGAEISILPMPHAAAASAATSLHAYTLPGTAGHPALVGTSPALVSTLVAAATAAQQAQHNAQLAAAAAGCLPVHAPLQLARFASVPAPPSKAMSLPVAPEPKGQQISHSTVEKQRRDRINSLIDELRELVPPQQRGGANGGAGAGAGNDAGGLEARRPKHVVLADTIQLLKHLQLKLSVGALEMGGATNGCYGNGNGYCNGGGSGGAGGRMGSGDEDTANSEGKASKGSSSHEDNMEVGGAPQMPHIPCQMTQMSGVTVERGPDCYYVQVKCRDRKGLLSDIINALRQLPLEIRTAAVTTTNGTVRDVFEVKLDDPGLSPEDVQNLVHDALFQSHLLAAQNDSLAAAGKRPRA